MSNNQNKPVIMIGGNGSNQQMSSLLNGNNLYSNGGGLPGTNKNDRFKKQPK